MAQEKTLTGYPSIDKPWLRYYEENAETKANDIPENKTVWDVIEERLYKYIDIPAIEYFGRTISRADFIKDVNLWAKTFKRLGVRENEVVPYYGVFMPDVCAMIFALNMIGACPYFLKLGISPKALTEETKDSRIAIVFIQMWENVREEFSKDRFEKVIVIKITDAMPIVKKQVVSILSAVNTKNRIPVGEKYIFVSQAKKLARGYVGNIKVDFVPGRPTFITSSSGTTVDGVVKGTVATNESVISQLYMGEASKIQYFPGDRCLNHFPPTASTSLNVLFLLALYKGETVVIDPRVSEKDFYNQVTKLKPNIVLTTGSSWEAFFNRVANEMKGGNRFDFSYAKGWTVGGEGTDCKKFKKWQEMMKKAKAKNLLFSGYGSSELFSGISVEKVNARYDYSKPIMSVGIPYVGIVMGVFDAQGNELSYNQRGELRIKSKSSMKEYYNRPELTKKVKVDEWICTGDLAEIDEKGFVYIWGRVNDVVNLPDGREIYLFDVANKIKEREYIDDAIVLKMPVKDRINLVAHIVWDKGVDDVYKAECLQELNESIKEYEPEITLCTYAFHDEMLPYSSTTLKKDKNKLSKQLEGYVQVDGKELKKVCFKAVGDGKYRIEKVDM